MLLVRGKGTGNVLTAVTVIQISEGSLMRGRDQRPGSGWATRHPTLTLHLSSSPTNLLNSHFPHL